MGHDLAQIKPLVIIADDGDASILIATHIEHFESVDMICGAE